MKNKYARRDNYQVSNFKHNYCKFVEEGKTCKSVQQLKFISQIFGDTKFGLASFSKLIYLISLQLRYKDLRRQADWQIGRLGLSLSLQVNACLIANIKNTLLIQVPTYFTSESMYRDFMSGAGYVLPWWALPCLYQQSFQLPYFFVEDVFLTGWIGIFDNILLVSTRHVRFILQCFPTF